MNKNIKILLESVAKEITKLIIIHILFYSIDGEHELLNEKFIKIIFYTIIALFVYYMIIKKATF